MDQGSGRSYWRDDEIIVDRDGVPHYTGEKPELLKEYKRRVALSLSRLEGSGDEEAYQAASLEKKKRRYRAKLLDGLHGRAWRRVEHLGTPIQLELIKAKREKRSSSRRCRASLRKQWS